MSWPFKYLAEWVLYDLEKERERQEMKFPGQVLPSGTGSEELRWEADVHRSECNDAFKTGTCTWRHVLLEEVFEALAEPEGLKLRAELIQVAAVCLRWVDQLDKEIK